MQHCIFYLVDILDSMTVKHGFHLVYNNTMARLDYLLHIYHHLVTELLDPAEGSSHKDPSSWTSGIPHCRITSIHWDTSLEEDL